jgi:hypothetical protein
MEEKNNNINDGMILVRVSKTAHKKFKLASVHKDMGLKEYMEWLSDNIPDYKE